MAKDTDHKSDQAPNALEYFDVKKLLDLFCEVDYDTQFHALLKDRYTEEELGQQQTKALQSLSDAGAHIMCKKRLAMINKVVESALIYKHSFEKLLSNTLHDADEYLWEVLEVVNKSSLLPKEEKVQILRTLQKIGNERDEKVTLYNYISCGDDLDDDSHDRAAEMLTIANKSIEKVLRKVLGKGGILAM